MKPLISIIIPTYNRAHLIGETLDSILTQTYTHWECIAIDDGSTDTTENALKEYVVKDPRFQYYKRPKNRPKSANTCRNYGLELAKGNYIIFFDSDDLMTPKHIEIKLEAIQKNNYDYAIAQTRFFNYDAGNALLEKQYHYQTKDITVHNYICHKISWLTYDTLIQSDLAKSISFNETLKAGQEYNYFCKLILKSTNALLIEDIVTLRRYHDASIRGRLRKNKIQQYQSYFNTYWQTYLDIQRVASDDSKRFLMYRCYRMFLKMPKKERPNTNDLKNALLKEFGLKAVYYILHLYFKNVI